MKFSPVKLVVLALAIGTISAACEPYQGGPCNKEGQTTTVPTTEEGTNYRVDKMLICEKNPNTGKLYWRGV